MLREADKDLYMSWTTESNRAMASCIHFIGYGQSAPFPVRFFKDELTVLFLCFLRYHAGNHRCPYPLFVLMQ